MRVARRVTPGLLTALLLAGCGSGEAEDFAVEIKRPAATVYAPLSTVDLAEARLVFAGLTVDRSRPSDTEILYTIPGSGDFPATIRFQLEPKGDATVVHAFVRAPAVRATIDGVRKEVSERKVERALESIVKATKQSLEMGSNAQAESRKLSQLLAGVAVATDKAHLSRALAFKDDPSKLLTLLMAFDTPGKQPAPDVDGREIRTVDPDAAQERRELAQANDEWKQQQALDRAAAPTSDLDRYDN